MISRRTSWIYVDSVDNQFQWIKVNLDYLTEKKTIAHFNYNVYFNHFLMVPALLLRHLRNPPSWISVNLEECGKHIHLKLLEEVLTNTKKSMKHDFEYLIQLTSNNTHISAHYRFYDITAAILDLCKISYSGLKIPYESLKWPKINNCTL